MYGLKTEQKKIAQTLWIYTLQSFSSAVRRLNTCNKMYTKTKILSGTPRVSEGRPSGRAREPSAFNDLCRVFHRLACLSIWFKFTVNLTLQAIHNLGTASSSPFYSQKLAKRCGRKSECHYSHISLRCLFFTNVSDLEIDRHTWSSVFFKFTVYSTPQNTITAFLYLFWHLKMCNLKE